MNIELKGISCKDISECGTYKIGPKDRLTYDDKSTVNKAAKAHAGMESLQHTMDRFRKINGWGVAKTHWNYEDNSFDVTLVENTKIKEVRHVSYDEICATLNWKSFKVIGNDTIKPIKMSFEECEALIKPKIEETNKRWKKWLKDHPEEAAKIAEENAKSEQKA